MPSKGLPRPTLSAYKTLWGAVVIALVLVPACGYLRPSARRLVERGKKLLAERNVPDAIVSFRRAIAASPLDEEAHYQLAVANLAIGNSRVGGEALMRAVQLKADDWHAVAKLGELMATSGDEKVLAGARDNLGQAVAHLPGDAAALTALAIVEWKLGAREAAESRLEQALSSHPEQLYSAITLARMKMVSGNAEGAEELLRAAAGGGEPASVIALAEFHMVAGRLEEAAGELRGALRREPGNAEARLDLAAIEASRHHMAAAAELYQALADLPDRRYRPLYGVFLLQTGKAEQAVAEFARLLKLDPADEMLRTNLLGAYLAAGRETDAERMLRAAVEKRNPGFDALIQKALFDLGKDRTGEAQVSVLTALRLRPEAAEAHYLHAAVLLRRGEVRSAAEELSEAVRRNPAFLPARLELARFQIAVRSPDVALEVLADAPAEQRAAPAAVAARAWVFLALGNRERFGAELKAAGPRGAGAMRIPEAVGRLEHADAPGAERIAEEVLAAHPADSRALLLAARSGWLEGGVERAIRNVRRHVENGLFLAELLLAAGRAPAALTALETAAPAGQRRPEFEIAMARAELRNGQPARAEERLAAEPDGRDALFLLGAARQMQGKYGPAAESYRKVLEGDAEFVPALHNLAYLLAEHLNMPEEALNLAQKARELAPESASVDDVLGWVLYRRDLASLAAIHLREAAASGFARAAAHLARMRARPDDPQGVPDNQPDPVALGWVDLGAADNTEARLETYRRTRGCQPDAAALDAVLRERNPRRFTERIIPPLMFCEPQPAFNPASMPSPQAVTLESVRTLWTSPDLMLQRLFGLSGVNAAEAPGWDNTFISWDETRSPLPEITLSPFPKADSAFRTADAPQDANGWDVYDSLWPGTFH